MYTVPHFNGERGTVAERQALIKNALHVVQLLLEHDAKEYAEKVLDMCAYIAYVNGETLEVYSFEPPVDEE